MGVAMESITLVTLDVVHREYKPAPLPVIHTIMTWAGTPQQQLMQQQQYQQLQLEAHQVQQELQQLQQQKQGLHQQQPEPAATTEETAYTTMPTCPADLAPVLISVFGMLAAHLPKLSELTLYGCCLDPALAAFGLSCPKLASLNVQFPHVPIQALHGIGNLLPHLTSVSVFSELTQGMVSGTAAGQYLNAVCDSIQHCKSLTGFCINLNLDCHPLYCTKWNLLPLSLQTLQCECELQNHESYLQLIRRVPSLTLQDVPIHRLLDFVLECPLLTHLGVTQSFRHHLVLSCQSEDQPAELKARLQAMTLSLKHAPLLLSGSGDEVRDTLAWLPKFPMVRDVTINITTTTQGRYLERLAHVFPDLISLRLRGNIINSITADLILLCSRMPRLKNLRTGLGETVDHTAVVVALANWGREISVTI